MRYRFVPAALLLLVVIFSLGCGGSSKGGVSGVVTVGGAKLKRGLITFLPDRGEGSPGAIIDGQYEIAEVPIGNLKVVIMESLEKPAPAPKLEQGNDLAPPPKTTAKKKDGFALTVPAKYHDANKSGLTTVVNKGPNTYSVDLVP